VAVAQILEGQGSLEGLVKNVLTVSSQVRYDNLNLALPPLYYVLGQSPKSFANDLHPDFLFGV
jgi:hypothetical protein